MAQQRTVVAHRDDEAKVHRISDFQLSPSGFEAHYSVLGCHDRWPSRPGRKGR